MGEMFSGYKELGLIGFLFVAMAGGFMVMIRFLLKSHEKKNNVIANHINHSTEIMGKVHNSLDLLNQTIRDMRVSIDRLLDKL